MNVDKKGLYSLAGGPAPSGSPASASASHGFTHPPPAVPETLVTVPRAHVLLVTLNRPAHLNAVTRAQHAALHRLWTWFDAEPSLRCAVVTGGGGQGRAFSAGADLKEWDGQNARGERSAETRDEGWAQGGFGGLSNRRGKKPVVAAVNGLCLGGAMEMVLNADMVLAREGATFGLPEVKVGVVAVAGALPRLVRIVGRQRASEMALLGRTDYTAEEMRAWGIVNRVVSAPSSSSSSASSSSTSSSSAGASKSRGKAKTQTSSRSKKAKAEEEAAAAAATVEEALRWASALAANSPDAVMVSREGLLGGWEAEDPQASTQRVEAGVYRRIDGGDNMREGVRAFVEKRKPAWKDSKL
ncbi:enoyl-CoA hydratase [Purpureocillium lavendulum]|uniref:Enoyl-CoA hydratase n=1 Tax=Purpureocillium lavendulum TaxID=1247861 RepID=A0AB34G0G7_9HYPO|nr:enoyl-CoA hydratase [Purpureocillium lavendulum]